MADKKAPTKSVKQSTPKKPRQKKINMKSIQSLQVEINKLYTFVLNEDTNEVIKYYKVFDESKIIALHEEAFAKLQYAKENEIEFFTDDSEFLAYVGFLAIKKFTHLEDELKNSTLEQDIEAMGMLLSTGLYKKILNDVFDGNETQKIYATMTNHIEASARALEAQRKLQQETIEKVESTVIKGKLQGTESYRNVLN